MILITGANGLIGSFIVRKCVEQGEQIRILARKNADLSLIANLIDTIEIFEGDILDIPLLEKACEGIEKLIHCAAIVSFGEAGIDTMFKVNVEGTKNIVNTCLKMQVRQLVYLSSIAAIGRDPKIDITDENTLWVESDLNSAYAKSKYGAELEVWRGTEEGLNASMLNPSIVLGPGNWNKSSTKIFKNIHEGIQFYPSGFVNVVDVRDVADAAYLLLKSNTMQERYIINGHHISYKDFFTQIAVGFGKRPPSLQLSKPLALVAYYLLKLFFPFYLKKRFINRETIVISSSNFRYSNQKFKKAFNFSYRPLNETIKWTCNEILK
ncbi:MAG: SDR family NAD(P)-dependent oxidoreductase [Cytophagales bacterium]